MISLLFIGDFITWTLVSIALLSEYKRIYKYYKTKLIHKTHFVILICIPLISFIWLLILFFL